MINYAETYEIYTPESTESGDADERGFIWEETSDDFRTMVDLLAHAEPSASVLTPSKHIWFTNTEYGHGTRDYYEKGIEETRSYHPKTERDARYMIKAWRVSNGK